MTLIDRQARKKVSRIFLVDDHPIVCDGFTRIIERAADLTVCGQASDAAEAMRLVNQLKPDLVVVDINLEGVSGLELIKQVRAFDPKALMLVVTMHDEMLFGERALRAGAKGYLRKKEVPSKIVDAIRQVLSGRVYVSEVMAERVLQRVARDGENADRPATDVLSDRELEVFQLVGQGLVTREIAEKLRLSKKTIESYYEQLKLKLHLKTGAELTRMAIRWQVEHE